MNSTRRVLKLALMLPLLPLLLLIGAGPHHRTCGRWWSKHRGSRRYQTRRASRTPQECLPTCSAGASRTFNSWLPLQTPEDPQGSPVSAHTTR